MNRPVAIAAGIGALCFALTACGSTVQLSGSASQASSANGNGLGLGLGLDQQSSSATPGIAAPGDLSAGQSGIASDSPTPVEGGINPGSGVGSGSTGRSASSGLVPKTFDIGLQYSSNANATLAAFGSKGANSDPKAQALAVLKWINAHGGIAGRPAVASFNNIDATASPAQESADACTQWAQDDKVQIAAPSSAVEDNAALRICLGKAGIPTLYQNVFSTQTTQNFASSPLWFEPLGLSLEDYARTYVDGLAAQGFFKGGKVGVVYNDQNSFAEVLKSTLLPALKAAGVSDAKTFAADINGASQLGSGTPQMSSAVLSFRSAGVNRVMFFEPWTGYFAFLTAARSQGYKPTYGLSSQEAPKVALDLGLIDPESLSGAKLVSWWPIADVGGTLASVSGPRAALCQDIYKKAGVPLGTARIDSGGQLAQCEALLLIQDAYRPAPARLSPSDFSSGMNALGADAQFASKKYGSFSPNKHWGVSEYWAGHFDYASKNFVLDGAPRPVQ